MLTLAQCEELPTPLSPRLQVGGQGQSLAFRKAEEVLADQPLRIDFYYSGEVLGEIRLLPGAVEEKQSKWIQLGFPDRDARWNDAMADAVTGPRVLITLEPVRPLSPIMEMTEASECSILDHSTESPRDDLRAVVSDLQRERDQSSAKQKELQMKVMELQQTLVQERWKARMDLELSEQRHKAEIGQLVIAAEKAKAAQKKDAVALETIRARVKDTEERLERELKEQKELCAGANAMVQSLQSQLLTATERIAQLERDLLDANHRCNSLSCELQAASCPAEVLDLRQSVATLQTALAASHAETDQREQELKQVTEHQRTKSVDQRTLKVSDSFVGRGECTVPDLVDDLLREYTQTRNVPVPLVRISEGQYSIGSKRITVTVRNGVLVIRVGGGFMLLDEFLKIYSTSESRFATPRRSLMATQRSTRKPHSVERTRHHRSVTAALDFSSAEALRLETESSEATDRAVLKPLNRDMSPRPVYWRETVSSHNKVTKKAEKSLVERGRVQVVKD